MLFTKQNENRAWSQVTTFVSFCGWQEMYNYSLLVDTTEHYYPAILFKLSLLFYGQSSVQMLLIPSYSNVAHSLCNWQYCVVVEWDLAAEPL